MTDKNHPAVWPHQKLNEELDRALRIHGTAIRYLCFTGIGRTVLNAIDRILRGSKQIKGVTPSITVDLTITDQWCYAHPVNEDGTGRLNAVPPWVCGRPAGVGYPDELN